MDWLINIYRQVPHELWVPLTAILAAVFTATVAFTGVVLTNRSAQKRHLSDLEHDEKSRQLERKSELRKLVYLEALADLGTISATLSSLWDFDKPLSFEQGMLSKAYGSSFRLFAIAEMETIRALAAASQIAGEIAIRTIPMRVAYEKRKALQQQVQSYFNRAVEHRDRVVAQLANDATIGPEKRKELEEERDRLNGLVEKSGKELLAVFRSFANNKIEILLLGAELKTKFDRELQAVILAIRAELQFPLDAAEFSTVMTSSSDQELQLMRTASDSLRAQLDDLFDEQKVSS
jgi:uncharacterized DUF497 family protein